MYRGLSGLSVSIGVVSPQARLLRRRDTRIDSEDARKVTQQLLGGNRLVLLTINAVSLCLCFAINACFKQTGERPLFYPLVLLNIGRSQLNDTIACLSSHQTVLQSI